MWGMTGSEWKTKSENTSTERKRVKDSRARAGSVLRVVCLLCEEMPTEANPVRIFSVIFPFDIIVEKIM